MMLDNPDPHKSIAWNRYGYAAEPPAVEPFNQKLCRY